MNPSTPETELRAMIGDLFMQLAVLRAELANAKAAPAAQAETTKPNGKGRPAEQSPA